MPSAAKSHNEIAESIVERIKLNRKQNLPAPSIDNLSCAVNAARQDMFQAVSGVNVCKAGPLLSYAACRLAAMELRR
jgi:hypothetical protein